MVAWRERARERERERKREKLPFALRVKKEGDMKNMRSLSSPFSCYQGGTGRNMHLKFVGLKRHLTAAEMSKTTRRLNSGGNF